MILYDENLTMNCYRQRWSSTSATKIDVGQYALNVKLNVKDFEFISMKVWNVQDLPVK